MPNTIPIFFVDPFDLGKSYDDTREEARRIVKLAQKNDHYDTRHMRKCLDTNWRERKDRIMTMHLKMLSDDLYNSLGNHERRYFISKANKIVSGVK